MATPAQTQPPPPGAGRAAAVGGVLGGVAGAVPGFVQTQGIEAVAAVGAKVAAESTVAVLAAMRRFLRRARANQAAKLFASLRARYPEETDDTLRRLVREELGREGEFQRKMIERLQRDLPIAFQIVDPAVRQQKVRAILDRERGYIAMREQAMAARALGAVERMSIKRISPQGAFWTLSPDVKKHTLDCIVLSGHFWPWEVLDELHPPLHPGCACHLLALQDAVAQGLMTADQVPDTQDAIRRARDLYERAKALEHAAGPGEVEGYLELLETYDPVLHPRDRHGRWLQTPDVVRAPMYRALRGLLPTPPSPPSTRRSLGRGEWRWAAGRRLFVPEHRKFDRVLGGKRYTSPPGGTNLYVDGKLTSDVQERTQVPRALVMKVTPPTVDTLVDHTQPLFPSVTVPPPAEPRPLLDRPPSTWNEWTDETNALTHALGYRYNAPVLNGNVVYDPRFYDHSGLEDWKGNIYFGASTKPSIERDAKLAQAGGSPTPQDLENTYNTYRSQAHEASHAVNPANEIEYTEPAGQVLEEGLAEEVAHVLARQNLRRQGRRDVLSWAQRHPTNDAVLGSYRPYRVALRTALDRAGVPSSSRAEVIFNLKFHVPPGERVAEFERMGHLWNPNNSPGSAEIASILTRPHDPHLAESVIPQDFHAMVSGLPAEGTPDVGTSWHRSKTPDGETVYERGDYKISRKTLDDSGVTGRMAYWDIEHKGNMLQQENSLASAKKFVERDHVARLRQGKADIGTDGSIVAPEGIKENTTLTAPQGTTMWHVSRAETMPSVAKNGLLTRDAHGKSYAESVNLPVGVWFYDKPPVEGLHYGRGDAVYKVDVSGLPVTYSWGTPGEPSAWYSTNPVDPNRLTLTHDPGKHDPGTGVTVARAADIYDGFSHGGVHAAVDRTESEANTANAGMGGVFVEGSLFDGTKPIGHFGREFQTVDGKLVVVHSHLNLAPQYQDRGIATAFNRHAEQGYRNLGVDHINITTAEVGGYAWARAGYSFLGDARQQVEAMLSARREDNWTTAIPKGQVSSEVVRNFEQRLSDGRFTSEASIAGFGHENAWTVSEPLVLQSRGHWTDVPAGTRMWLGKLFMLGTSWSGTKRLTGLQEADVQAEADVCANLFDQMGLHVTPDTIWNDDDEAFWSTVDQQLAGA